MGCSAPGAVRDGCRGQSGRCYAEAGDDPRTAFQRDRDRILHSAAFRRLQYKTQVYVFHEGDFYRTRLTHSLEVAQIAAALAHMVGANPDLAWAISLAHDLGHPPFGHGGEDELNELMAADGGFEHNAQALRIVDELEIRYPDFPGLNLTWEVREGIVRHETFFDSPRVPDEFGQWPQPGLEAQLSNLADMIAYCTHDLEDALAIGFLREDELEHDIALWRDVPQPQPGFAYTPLAEREMVRRFRVRALIDRLITCRGRGDGRTVAAVAPHVARCSAQPSRACGCVSRQRFSTADGAEKLLVRAGVLRSAHGAHGPQRTDGFAQAVSCL